MKRIAAPLIILLSSALCGCVSTRSAAVVPPPGPDCGVLITEFQQKLAEDSEAGRLKRDVYGRAAADTRQAAEACSAGRQVQARSILIATKRNYGYEI